MLLVLAMLNVIALVILYDVTAKDVGSYWVMYTCNP